jgi:hypothetical protein
MNRLARALWHTSSNDPYYDDVLKSLHALMLIGSAVKTPQELEV